MIGIAEACRHLTVMERATADMCKIDSIVNERIDGIMGKLPGLDRVGEPVNMTDFLSSDAIPYKMGPEMLLFIPT